MRSLFIAASFLVACGSRTPLDLGGGPLRGDGDDAGPADAARIDPADAGGTQPSPGEPPPGAHVVPDGLSCYGDVTHVHGLSCGAEWQGGRTCDGTLNCNGEDAVSIHCERGLCHCTTSQANDCYCHAPENVEDSCGPLNCCWQ